MLNSSGLLYLSARAVSAAGNLLAVAIFSRLAGPAEYGHYVLIFAWSLIVYGFGGTRVVQGHGTLVFPMVQICKDLSLELMSFDVAPQQCHGRASLIRFLVL